MPAMQHVLAMFIHRLLLQISARCQQIALVPRTMRFPPQNRHTCTTATTCSNNNAQRHNRICLRLRTRSGHALRFVLRRVTRTVRCLHLRFRHRVPQFRLDRTCTCSHSHHIQVSRICPVRQSRTDVSAETRHGEKETISAFPKPTIVCNICVGHRVMENPLNPLVSGLFFSKMVFHSLCRIFQVKTLCRLLSFNTVPCHVVLTCIVLTMPPSHNQIQCNNSICRSTQLHAA